MVILTQDPLRMSLDAFCKMNFFTFGQLVLNYFQTKLLNDNPRQQNGSDCGVFVCRYGNNIMNNKKDNFTIGPGEYRDEIKKVINRGRQLEPANDRIIDPTIKKVIFKEEYLASFNQKEIQVTEISYFDLADFFCVK